MSDIRKKWQKLLIAQLPTHFQAVLSHTPPQQSFTYVLKNEESVE